jgi:peptide/nickel transport system permease protein
VFFFVLRRLLITIPLLFLASIITFVLVINLPIPQQLENLIAKPNHSLAAEQQLRHQYQLDVPPVERYVNWITDFVKGDWGQDSSQKDVKSDMWRAIQVTLRLLVFSTIMSVLLGVIVGMISAVRQYTAFDYITTGMAFFFFSIPTAVLAGFLKVYGIVEFNKWARHPTISTKMVFIFLVLGALCGYMVLRNRYKYRDRPPLNKRLLAVSAGLGIAAGGMLVFALIWGGNTYREGNPAPLIPTLGQASSHPPEEWWPRMQDYFWHMVGPSLTLILVGFAGYSRYMRASMLDVLNSDYVRTARSKGVRESKVIVKHAMRNALIPLTTAVALDFGALLGGAIITETIFSWKGMGVFFTKALGLREPAPILAFVMVTAIFVIIFNLIADILYAQLDPRIRLD